MIFLWAWLSIFILMCVVWLYYRQTNNPGIVDVAWSLSHWLGGSIFLFAHNVNPRTIVIWLLLTLWALRLAGYLFWTRIRTGEIDKRYTKISEQWKMAPSMGFFINFQFQGLLVMFIITSLYFSGNAPIKHLNMLDGIGISLIAVAVFMETLADVQLRNFVQKNKGKVCDVGLWAWSRHPNYFFEWLVWVGFAFTGLSTQYGWIGIISPITLYLIMTQITGPITEQGSLASKGEAYKQYQEKTPMFFPRQPKGN